MAITAPTPAGALRTDGFTIVPDVLDATLLSRLRAAGDALEERWSAKVGDELLRAQGSMVDVPHQGDPVFGELIVHPPALAALDALGLGDATFTDGYVISKPPRSPRLYWHFDWYGWGHPSAHRDEPLQVFVMYYLTDTTVQNGCLRVLPGSHRQRHPVHDLMVDGHEELGAATDLHRPEYASWPDEVAVPVQAGDAVIGDARLPHAAHANDTDERRTVVTLWYQPHFAALPAPVRATLAAKVQSLPDLATRGASPGARVAPTRRRSRRATGPLRARPPNRASRRPHMSSKPASTSSSSRRRSSTRATSASSRAIRPRPEPSRPTRWSTTTPQGS